MYAPLNSTQFRNPFTKLKRSHTLHRFTYEIVNNQYSLRSKDGAIEQPLLHGHCSYKAQPVLSEDNSLFRVIQLQEQKQKQVNISVTKYILSFIYQGLVRFIKAYGNISIKPPCLPLLSKLNSFPGEFLHIIDGSIIIKITFWRKQILGMI